MAKDNWKHRIKGMTCQACMWFVPKHVDDKELQIGRCRRHAPTMSGFPVVFNGDWCGDHKINEEVVAETNAKVSV